MNMNYINWFLKNGWKKYSFPFILGAILTFVLIAQASEIYQNNSMLLTIGIFVICVGFDLGISYHSYLAFKAETKENKPNGL